MTRRLIMLRHGQTDYNATRRMQGHLNTKLSPVGFEQAAAAADFLTNKNIIKIVSSDLDRAFDTATVIGQRLNLPVEKTNDSGNTFRPVAVPLHDEVDQLYPGMRALWRHDATWAPPGGESRVEVARRARPVVTELMQSLADWDSATVLLVAHGGIISALTVEFIGASGAAVPAVFRVGERMRVAAYRPPALVGRRGSGAVDAAGVQPRHRGRRPMVFGWVEHWGIGIACGFRRITLFDAPRWTNLVNRDSRSVK